MLSLAALRTSRTASLLFCSIILCACAPAPVQGPSPLPAGAPDLQLGFYAQQQAAGRTVLRIDPHASIITVLVRRGGALARLGHDHVVASRQISGMVAPEANRADLYFRLDEMSVDEEALRSDAGLMTQPSADAIAGTRTNMLTRVLDAANFPFASMRVHRASDQSDLSVTLTLHGVTREMTIPARVETSKGAAGTAITISGTASIRQTDFGLVPFSVMGGAMAVQDQLNLGFHIEARTPGMTVKSPGSAPASTSVQ